ncbi:helix-turn-helix domain-containing protein [Streptomyces sp. NPDC052309]|uniref:helix-turn-helix domain-containing protein n=1 Tax=Streptomyces sp. NPDC052309 TaxID=3155421 RepID=UPI00343764CC
MKDPTLVTSRWRALDVLHRRMATEIDRHMRTELEISMREYHALMAIVEHADSSKRQVCTLAGNIGLSASATSRLLIRLYNCGLITVAISGDDRRTTSA